MKMINMNELSNLFAYVQEAEVSVSECRLRCADGKLIDAVTAAVV